MSSRFTSFFRRLLFKLRARKPRIGLALGAGGARGLAHILALEVLDELKVKPDRIAGTSIGAIIGVLYASGMSAREIRELVENLIQKKSSKSSLSFIIQNLWKWLDFINLRIGAGGMLSSRDFVRFVLQVIGCSTFGELKIPLQVCAADLWNREQVIFDSGPLQPALEAAIAFPGLFTPVKHSDITLVDGGTVNPVPYDMLEQECDISIAVDVLGMRVAKPGRTPSVLDAVFNSIQIMQAAMTQCKIQKRPPTIYVKPEIRNVRLLEFNKIGSIFEQAAPAIEEFKKQLRRYR